MSVNNKHVKTTFKVTKYQFQAPEPTLTLVKVILEHASKVVTIQLSEAQNKKFYKNMAGASSRA